VALGKGRVAVEQVRAGGREEDARHKRDENGYRDESFALFAHG
jgi:hypothetical protein